MTVPSLPSAPRALLLAAALLAAPLAHADDDCRVELGRGWPPATENHGAAVERLLDGGLQPALRLTRLPAFAKESGLLLIPGEGEGDWTLRVGAVDERVSRWSGGRLELRVDQQPDVEDVPMPAPLARRVVATWQRAFAALVPADRAAEFVEAPTSFLAGDLRVSGIEPDCGPGEQLMEQVELLAKAAAESDDEDRPKRWRRLAEALDQFDTTLAGVAGAGAGEVHGND